LLLLVLQDHASTCYDVIVRAHLHHRAGIGTEDSALADWLRRTVDTPVLLAANKCERRKSGVSGELTMVHSIHSDANVALETWSIAAAPANNACVITYPLLAADVGDVLAEATRLGFGDAVAVSAETGVRFMH
jgi:hypothetical protein